MPVRALQKSYSSLTEGLQTMAVFTMARGQFRSDLGDVVERAVQEEDWTVLQQWMDSRQLTDQQKANVIVDMTSWGFGPHSSSHSQPFCSSGQLNAAMELLVSEDSWTEVSTLCNCAGTLEWRVGDLSVSNRLLSVVAQGRWLRVWRDFQDDLSASPALKRWVLLQACQRAEQEEIIEIILPRCEEGDWDGALQHLVRRGLWAGVMCLFTQQRRARTARCLWDRRGKVPWDDSPSVLPHCTARQLISVSRQLVERRLWWALHRLLETNAHVFSSYVFRYFGNEDTDLFMSYLQHEDRLDSALSLLKIVGNKRLQWKYGDVSIDGELIRLAAEGQWRSLACQSQVHTDPAVATWAMEQMSRKAERNEMSRKVSDVCPISEIPSMITNFVKRGFFEDAAMLVCRLVDTPLRHVVTLMQPTPFTADAASESEMEDFDKIARNSEKTVWNLLTKHSFDLKDVDELCLKAHKAKRKYGSEPVLPSSSVAVPYVEELSGTPVYKMFGTVLFDSAVSTMLMALCDRLETLPEPQSLDAEVQWAMNQMLTESRPDADVSRGIRRLCIKFKSSARNDSVSDPVFALSFILAVVKYMKSPMQTSEHPLNTFLAYLSAVPVVPELQRQALQVLVRINVWDLPVLADLSRVGEQVRTVLFSSAVRQKQWSVVRQWADHTLHDDQRRWAVDQACEDRQWDVCLRLAEHGLTEAELTHLHCRVVQTADREVVLQMYEHEADVVEVKEQLTTSKHRMASGGETEGLPSEAPEFLLTEIEARLKSRLASFTTLERAVAEGDWQVVVFALRQRPAPHSVSLALRAAVAGQAWSAVKQLVRVGIPASDHQPLLADMVSQGQWGVCRAMVERGLGAERYAHFIPQLLEADQWTLVGMMVRHVTDDAVRRQVMQRALQRKEGSVVGQCIAGMTLTVRERDDVFHTAVVGGVMQAVLPLVTETDDTGVRHRDVALLHAIHQQQWDVVDRCLQHHADINTPDAGRELPIHTAAQDRDWRTVLALAERGADISRPDGSGQSVLHRAIAADAMSCVKKLIPFCNDLLQDTSGTSTLTKLIDGGRRDIVADALSQDNKQWKGVSSYGETALHAMCLAGWHENIGPLLLHGVEPLALTHRGHSALSYAVLCEHQPRDTVAQCISQGLSTHQPPITKAMQQRFCPFVSPVLLAVMRGLPVVTQMLYESGSCSSEELLDILPCLLQLTADPDTVNPLEEAFGRELQHVNAILLNEFCWGSPDRPNAKLVRQAAQYLAEVGGAPRSLKSLCRLAVSRAVGISGTRHTDIAQLQIPLSLKDDVSFADLTRPHLGRQWTV